MCGIFGIYNFNDVKVREDKLKKYTLSLQHRGPDALGVWSYKNVGLGHTRLSIIDLSKRANQPFITVDGKYVLAYNGEIYNYKSLKTQLKTPYEYRTDSDTELLINGLAIEKENFINKIEGMFSFSFYDKNSNEMLIARDSFGIKPLYYHYNEDRLIFSSEIKTLLLDNSVKVEVDYDALKEVFLLGYNMDPNTCFKNIHRLRPGHFMKINRDGIKIEEYWSVFELLNNNTNVDWLDIFDESIRMHCLSDVSIGSLLSGGIDSNLILRSMKNQGLLDSSFNAYNAGSDSINDEHTYLERDLALKSANFFGVNLVKIDSGDNENISFEDSVRITEEPISNTANILIDKICKKANDLNQKVLLSGHGGDEVFAGYRRHLIARHLSLMRKFGIGKVILFFNKYFNNDLFFRVGNASLVKNKHPLFNLLSTGSYLLNRKQSVTDWINTEDIEKTSDKLYSNIKEVHNESFLRQALLLEFSTYLPIQNLMMVDKFSMRNSIELRVPFLYRPLLKIGLNTNENKLINGLKTKNIIRNSSESLLPKFLINTPKMGFAPLEYKLVNSEEIKSILLSKTTHERGLFSSKRIENLFFKKNKKMSENIASQLINIANIEQWLRFYG